MLIEDGIKLTFGGEAIYASAPMDAMGSVNLAGHTYQVYYLFVMAMAAAAGISMWWIMVRTRLGIMLRAIEMDRDMAQAMGIPMRQLTIVSFVLGARAGRAGRRNGGAHHACCSGHGHGPFDHGLHCGGGRRPGPA